MALGRMLVEKNSSFILDVGTISDPDMRVKHCACGHSVVTLLNPRGVTAVSYKYSLTVVRHAIVVVAVPSTVHYPAHYKIKI
jgi:hypothetical protein